MRLKIAVAVFVVLVGGVAAVVFFVNKRSLSPEVQITLRISVDPAGQSQFVIQQAGSAKFKYLVGKSSGVKPVFAQRLALKPVPGTSQVEARVGVATKDQANRYIESFMQTLQWQCGNQARLKLTAQSVR